MARKKREWYPGATCHVMSRGVRRQAIFKEESDYLYFLELMKKVRKRYPFTIHSICLMTNHFHIEIETGEDELGKIMGKILSAYAVYFNYNNSYKGHLFEGRYKSSIIKNEMYFLEVSRYIHLNPVKASMVRDPLSYEYSSYGLFLPYSETDKKSKFISSLAELVDTTRVLNAFGHDSRQQYKMFVEGKLSHAEQEMLIMKDMGEDEMWLPW